MSRRSSRNHSRINLMGPLAGLLVTGLSFAAVAAAQSVPYPTYVTGPQPNGSWVVSNGQVITPAGTQVDLGIRVRAKAVALNPNVRTHTAAVLTLGAAEAVEVIDHRTGGVLQKYITFGGDPSGSYSGIAYSAGGNYLMFSQDSSHVAIAKVSEQVLLKTTLRSGCRRTIPSSPAFRTALRAMAHLAGRSSIRALLIPAAPRSQTTARAPTSC